MAKREEIESGLEMVLTIPLKLNMMSNYERKINDYDMQYEEIIIIVKKRSICLKKQKQKLSVSSPIYK